MHITREDYDDKPILIKQGALILWGIPLIRWVSGDDVHHLYQLNDFYAEMCSCAHTGRLTYIRTCANDHWPAPYRPLSAIAPVRLSNVYTPVSHRKLTRPVVLTSATSRGPLFTVALNNGYWIKAAPESDKN